MRVIVLGVVVMCAAMLALAAPASAHVTVSAPGAPRGGSDTVITFRVPAESDTAATTGLRVQLPADTPIEGVLVAPAPGWTHTEHRAGDAVSEIDWTATGPGIRAGEFGEFVILAGELPDTPR